MNIKWTLILPSVTLLIALFLWWTQHAPAQNITSTPLAKACNLHQQACYNTHQDIKLSLDITPKPIPIAKQLAVNAHIEGVTPTRVQLDINGSNMYMGYNRITLKQQADGSWTGKMLLAFCTIDRMEWQLTLLIDLADGSQLQAPFPLTTPFTDQ
jgi:hypothetical protein